MWIIRSRPDPGHDLGVHEVLPRAADLPQRAVRLLPDALEVVGEQGLQRPGVVVVGEPGLTGAVQPVEELAVDVELELPRCLVADPHRPGPLVALEPAQLGLGKSAPPGEGVHDLQVLGVAGDGSQQPVAPGLGLLGVPAAGEGLQGEGGVAQPAVAVVPVPGAADLLRQGGGGRGGDAPARRVGQRLEHQQRPSHRLAVAGPRRCSGRSSPSRTAAVSREGPFGVVAGRLVLVGGHPGQHEGHPLAGLDGELRHAAHVPAAAAGPACRATGSPGRRRRPTARRCAAPTGRLARSRTGRPARRPSARVPLTPSTIRIRSGCVCRIGMKSVTGRCPRRSPTSTPGPSCRRGSAAGCTRRRTTARSASGRPSGRRAARRRTAEESNRGRHSQSIEPSRLTSAAVCRSATTA